MPIRPVPAISSMLVRAHRVVTLGRLRLLLGTSQSLLVLRLRFRNRHLATMPYAAARSAAGQITPPLAPASDAGGDSPIEPTPTLAGTTPATPTSLLDVFA